MTTKKLTDEERLYEELGELDEVVLRASKDLARVYKRRQEIYEIMDWI